MNLTMEKVREHDKRIYDLEVGLVQLKNSLIELSNDFDYSVIASHLLRNAQTTVHQLMIGLTAAQHNVDKILEYLRAMATHQCSPVIISPPVLPKLLQKVEDRLTPNPRLKLPYNSKTDIWHFYDILRITPVVLDKLLVVLLTIPLTDQSLEINIFRVHNLPLVHLEYHTLAKYKIEGEYLAIGKEGMYIALPDENSIQICMMSDLGLCTIHNALYPSKLVEWCIYALYTENEEKIDKHCRYEFEYTNRNYARSLGGFMWVISAIIAEKLQIRCLTETHVVEIRPPIEVVYIGNRCEGYSPHLYIAARSTLTSEINVQERGYYFMAFNSKYSRDTTIGIWHKLQFKLQDREDAMKQVKLWTELQPMTFEYLNKKIDTFGHEYPVEIPTKPLLLTLIIVTMGVIVVMIIGIIKWWKGKQGMKEIKEWAKLVSMGDFMKFKPTSTTVGNPEEGPQPSIAPAEPVYKPPPHTHQTVVSIEQPSAVPQLDTEPQMEVCWYETTTGSLTSVTSADISLEYGSVHVSPGPLKEVVRQVIHDQ